MAHMIEINNNREIFGLYNTKSEILNTIEKYMGYEFALFVENNFIEGSIAGFDDIIRFCENFDEETDDISVVLNEIELIAETCQSELNGII